MSVDPGSRHPLLRLLPFLGKYRRPILVGTTMVLLTNFAAVLSPWILGRAIDHLSVEISQNLLAYYALLIVGVSAVEGIFRFQMRSTLIGVSRRIEYDLRDAFFQHLQSLPTRFFRRTSTGDVMARASNDLSAVRMVLGPGIMYSVNTLSTSLLAIAILLSINARLAFLTLIPLACVSLTVKYFGRKIHERFEKIQEQFSDLTSLAQENLSGVRVIKAYNQEEAYTQRFEAANREYINRSLSLVRISGLYSPLLALLLGLSAVALLWYGGLLVMRGTISLGDFVAFMAYLSMLAWPTIALGWVVNIFERGSASMRRINQILDEPSEHLPTAVLTSGSPMRLQGEIEVHGLNFSYNGRPVLKDISFPVQPGQTLAIVGATGSGKSTLADLLCRLHPVPSGTIRIDGLDINDLPLDTLRRHIGYVPQDTFLFSETISENIAFGRPDARPQEIERVAHVSNIWPDIQEFPKQFQTFVGERGITLSGGQKQRIAISRALLINPAILILDDALSSVDTYTEEQILDRLGEYLKDRTSILISHRISTIRHADQILVLEGGEIVERGTHEELLQLNGLYADLYEKQLLREELGLE